MTDNIFTEQMWAVVRPKRGGYLHQPAYDICTSSIRRTRTEALKAYMTIWREGIKWVDIKKKEQCKLARVAVTSSQKLSQLYMMEMDQAKSYKVKIVNTYDGFVEPLVTEFTCSDPEVVKTMVAAYSSHYSCDPIEVFINGEKAVTHLDWGLVDIIEKLGIETPVG